MIEIQILFENILQHIFILFSESEQSTARIFKFGFKWIRDFQFAQLWKNFFETIIVQFENVFFTISRYKKKLQKILKTFVLNIYPNIWNGDAVNQSNVHILAASCSLKKFFIQKMTNSDIILRRVPYKLINNYMKTQEQDLATSELSKIRRKCIK